MRPGRRALVATATVVVALLPVSLIAAVSALGDAPGESGNSGAGPAIVGFSPQRGTIRGGTVVHISGGGFEGATGVFFGDRPARSFTVRSANLIDASAPSVPRGRNVRIKVGAAGGAAISSAEFEFIGCHVPRLPGDQLGRARRTIAAAHCLAGEVVRAPGARRPLRVVGESPRPGKWLELGAVVSLRVR